MIPEILALFGFIIVLTCMGFGLSSWIFAPPAYPVWVRLAAAPTIGFSVIGLIGFPLFRYVAPVRFWAWPVTGVLLVISMLLFVRSNRTITCALQHSWRACALGAGLLTILLGARAIPLYVARIHHTVFAANPADAFSVMTLAESTRRVDWRTLSEGSDLGNAEGVRKLAQESPTALFSARFLSYPIRMTSMVVLAYSAELFGIETYRFYYPFKVASLALAVPVIFLLGWQLQLPHPWSIGLATAFYLGFWAQMNLELDSLSQVNAIPLCLLLISTITRLIGSNGDAKTTRKLQALIALLCAALCCYYPEYLFLAACAGAITMLTLATSENIVGFARTVLPAGLASIGLLLISGQLFYLVRYQLFIAKWTATAGGGSSHPLMPIFMDVSLPRFSASIRERSFWHFHTRFGSCDCCSRSFLAASCSRCSATLRMHSGVHFHEGKVVIACVAGGLAMYNIFVIGSGEYTAAKALIFSCPFFALAIGASLKRRTLSDLDSSPRYWFPQSLFVIWVLSQLSVGAFQSGLV